MYTTIRNENSRDSSHIAKLLTDTIYNGTELFEAMN